MRSSLAVLVTFASLSFGIPFWKRGWFFDLLDKSKSPPDCAFNSGTGEITIGIKEICLSKVDDGNDPIDQINDIGGLKNDTFVHWNATLHNHGLAFDGDKFDLTEKFWDKPLFDATFKPVPAPQNPDNASIPVVPNDPDKIMEAMSAVVLDACHLPADYTPSYSCHN